MEYILKEADQEDKKVIYNLMQLYTYELSKYSDDTAIIQLNNDGLYKFKYFDLFWKEDTRHPFILYYGDKLAGFVLVRFNEECMYEISEFFVLPEFRRSGAGTYMANEMFKMFKCKWEIRTLLKNKNAQGFWRNTVNEFSKGKFEEKYIRNNSRYAFYFESK